MGYFANGTEGMMYQAVYCDRCVHDRDNDCPILALHFLWNYDQNRDKEKKMVLDMFIPQKGIENEQCKMFRPKQTRQKSQQMKLIVPAETK